MRGFVDPFLTSLDVGSRFRLWTRFWPQTQLGPRLTREADEAILGYGPENA